MARSWWFSGLACVASLGGCATPPAAPTVRPIVLDVERYPPGAELVDIPTTSGAALRAVFIPGEPGAPLVLHFVEAPEVLAAGASGPWGLPLTWHLRDLGLGVLVVDAFQATTPVAENAEAAYAEALRRAGSEANVVVRGASVGTLPIAHVLEAGRNPAVVVLGAPVRATTFAEHVGKSDGDALVWMVPALMRRFGDADLATALRAYRGRKLAYVTAADDLLDASEREAITEAVQGRHGRVVLDVQASHVQVTLRMHALLGAEHALYATAFPGRVLLAGDLFQRRVIDSPALAEPLAAALERSDAFEEGLVLRWLRRLPPTFAESMPPEALRAMLDFGDPLGRLDARELDWMGDVVAEVRADWAAALSTPGAKARPFPEALFLHIADHELDRRTRYTIRHAWSQEPIEEVAWDLVDGPQPWGAPARLNLDANNSRRQLVRIALKAAGIPDRVGFDAYATPHIEVFEDGVWRTLDPELAH